MRPVWGHQGSCLQLTKASVLSCRGIYSATKGAVLRLSDALRLECRPLGIQVLLVAPGFIDTKARSTAKVRNCGPAHLQGVFLHTRKLNFQPSNSYCHMSSASRLIGWRVHCLCLPCTMAIDDIGTGLAVHVPNQAA
jgi:hypothetical protein